MQKPGVFRQHIPGGKSEMGYTLCILTAKTAWFLQQLKQPVAKLSALLFDPSNEREVSKISFQHLSGNCVIFRFFNSVICIQGKRLSRTSSTPNFFSRSRINAKIKEHLYQARIYLFILIYYYLLISQST